MLVLAVLRPTSAKPLAPAGRRRPLRPQRRCARSTATTARSSSSRSRPASSRPTARWSTTSTSTRPRASSSSTATSRASVLTGYVDRIAINQAIADARRDSIEPDITDAYLREANAICGHLRDARSTAGRYPTIAGKKPLKAAYDAPPRASCASTGARSPAPPRRPSAARLKKQWLKVMTTPSAAPRAALKAARRASARRKADALRGRRRHARPHVQRGRPHRLREQPPVVDSALVDRERFTEHLAAPNGRGVVLSGGHDGHAGGAVCGDLIRVSVRVEGDRVTAAGFDAVGLRRDARRRLGGRHAGRGRAAARRRARGHARDRRRARRALAGQAARRRSGRRRAAPRARRGRRRRGDRARPEAHAGRHERRRGLRRRRAARRRAPAATPSP